MTKSFAILCRKGFAATLALLALTSPAWAGPPYLSDDPEPTDYQHFEIYAFGLGTSGIGGTEGETGIDFNYGGAPDLQLTAVIPMAFRSLSLWRSVSFLLANRFSSRSC